MLKVQALTKRFGDKVAVGAASFEIDRPAMIGAVCRSGAGKSSLPRMVKRLADSSDGRIMFQGEDVTALRGRTRRAAR